ncbi:MAG TPA: hypothetical protein VEH79_00775 [Gaiellaceae bacterium]|nr:hypothetical protein [Gaiellaceae bacterium]
MHARSIRLVATATMCASTLAGATAQGAQASQLIDRNATGVRLEVNARGQALLTYRTAGKLRHVLALGAINAIPPSIDRPQVRFELDYAGGWGIFGHQVWKTFRNSCKPYTGPPLAWLVTACTAPDGSYWAVQAWQRELPDYGVAPVGIQSSWELRLSHWSTPLPVLTIDVDWAYRRFDHLFGSFTYLGQPVYGFGTTPQGATLDAFGRNVYVDTLDSAYGLGWKRENSFVTHRGTGTFCYGFYPHGDRPAGKGTRYRATVIGPGVTPDVTWEGSAPGPFDRSLDLQLAQAQRSLMSGDPLCKPV